MATALTCSFWLLTSAPTQAQPVDLEALEAQLEKLKREEAEENDRNKKEAARQREAKRLASVPFVPVADGVLDNQQGLVWEYRDYGRDIDWTNSMNYCARDGGWSLPTVPQLQGLYDSDAIGTRCGSTTCMVPYLLVLTSTSFWSSEKDGSSSAFYVSLNDGGRYSVTVSDSNGKRALCVRRRT